MKSIVYSHDALLAGLLKRLLTVYDVRFYCLWKIKFNNFPK